MFCPQCGQQQISENSRFCSRCGLLVGGLPEWIARGGMVPFTPPTPPGFKPQTPKRKGMRRGAKLMFISAVLFPLFFGFAVAADTPGPLVVPITIFFAGLAVLLYSVLFGEDTIAIPEANEPSRLKSLFGSKSALPPAPANVHMQPGVSHPVRTSELVERPASVTENTTRLLDRE